MLLLEHGHLLKDRGVPTLVASDAELLRVRQLGVPQELARLLIVVRCEHAVHVLVLKLRGGGLMDRRLHIADGLLRVSVAQDLFREGLTEDTDIALEAIVSLQY